MIEQLQILYYLREHALLADGDCCLLPSQMSGVLGPLKVFYRYLDVEIEERKKLYANSPDSCPDDVLTALISQHPPVSDKFKGGALLSRIITWPITHSLLAEILPTTLRFSFCL
jgi:hypothetical protein